MVTSKGTVQVLGTPAVTVLMELLKDTKRLIVNGKLYLNYVMGVKALSNNDQQGFIKMADKNWDTMKKEKD